MKKITLLFFLFVNISLFGQKEKHIDLVFQEQKNALTAKSESNLLKFLSNVSKVSPVFEVETFPPSSESIRRERSDLIIEYLNEINQEAEKIVHFQKKEHLYFPTKEIDYGKLIRLKAIYVECFPKKKVVALNQMKFNHKTEIDSRTTTTIKLKKGTVIHLQRNSFCFLDGSPYKGIVILKTKEILTKSDAVLANVTTNLHGGGALESRGMIDISAETIDNKPLEIRKGKHLDVIISSDKTTNNDQFKIYKGIKVNGSIAWLLDTVQLKTNIRPVYEIFKWKRLKKEKRDSIRKIRAEYINLWVQNGHSSKNIKRRLKRYRSFVKRRFWKNYDRKFKKTKSGRDYSKLSKAMVLGKTKYCWEKLVPDTNRTKFISKNRFAVRSLGMYNIDRPFGRFRRARSQNIIVRNPEKRDLKLAYKGRFVVLRGEQVGDETIFKNIVQGREILIMSIDKKTDGNFNFGFIATTPEEKVVEISDYELMSQEKLSQKVRALMKNT